MICPVVTYAPTAATKPNIAAHPLKRSASGVIRLKYIMLKIVTGNMNLCKVFLGISEKIIIIFLEITLL